MAVFGVPVVHEDDALARGAGGGRDAGRAPGAGAGGADRSDDGRGGDGDGGAARDRRRGQRRRSPGAGCGAGRGAARAADARARAGRGRGRGGRATRAEGQGRAGSRLPARAGPRRAGAAARHAVRRTRARARAPTGGVAARSDRAVLRAGDRGRRRRDRQVTAGGGGCGVRGRDGRARPLPPLRRGDHLLARRRGAETARPHACRRDGGEGDPLAARPERCGDVGGGDRLGLPEDAGTGRVGAAAGGRVRRHPVGRGDLPRPHRARRAALLGRVDPAALHGTARAHRAAGDVAGDAQARAPARRRRARAHPRGHPRRPAGEDLSRRGRQPALRRGDGRDGRRGRGRGRRPSDAARAARRPARPARAGRATHPRVRRDRGRDLPPGCHPGTRARRDAGHPAPRRARPQGADPAGQTADRGRGRLPLPPPADPRRGVRGAPQVGPRGSPSAPGRLAGGARDRARGARRDPRLPPGAGTGVSRRARFARRPRAGGCGTETPDGSRLARARASGLRCGRAPARPRCRASTADGDRRSARAPPGGSPRGRGPRPRRHFGKRSRSPSAPRQEETGPASSAACCSTGSSSRTSRRRAPRSSWMPSPSRRCPSCSSGATTSRCAPCTRRADGPRSAVAGRTLRATRTTWQPFTRGAPASSTSTWAGVRSAASTGRPPSPSSSRGSTPTSHEPATTTGIAPRGRWPLAWQGGFDEARELLAASRAELAERGGSLLLGGLFAIESNKVEQLAGDAAAAAEFGAHGCSVLEQLGDEGFLSSAASCLAQALYRLDRLDEARYVGGRARPSSARATTP